MNDEYKSLFEGLDRSIDFCRKKSFEQVEYELYEKYKKIRKEREKKKQQFPFERKVNV